MEYPSSQTEANCVKYGHCDRRCPFHALQSHRMQEIQNYFFVNKYKRSMRL